MLVLFGDAIHKRRPKETILRAPFDLATQSRCSQVFRLPPTAVLALGLFRVV